MSRNKSLLAALALLVLAVPLVLWAILHKKPAPDVTFTTLNGQKVALHDLRGKVVLVNFWATSCPGCVEEMPQLRQTWQAYHSRGLEIVAVAASYDPPSYVLRFNHDYKLPFAVTLDTTGAIAHAFGDVQLTPTSFIIDRQGRIIQQTIGALNFPSLRQLLDTRLPTAGKGA